MNAVEWLGRWEPLDSPGRHSKIEDAGFACGYRFDRRPKPITVPTMWDRVNRAIPVEGTVTSEPCWKHSPQVRCRMEIRETVLDRIVRWLKK